MKNKALFGITGFVVGVIIGGFLGLVLGGTFLGGFDIHEATGLEGYEISAYVGALIGGVTLAIAGARIGEKRRKEK